MGSYNKKGEIHTDKIIRDHFGSFVCDGVYLHEKDAGSPGIERLLKGAPKSGNGKGAPDFIIEFRENDFLIVVESKADTKKHKSKTLDQYTDYAVDGALFYSSHLVKSYDVLSIGVSGTTKKNLRITHHLALKENPTPFEIFGDALLPKNDYLEGYLQNPKKLKQNYNELIAFIRNLNARLHINKVSETKRAIFISILLIALSHLPFKESYRTKNSSRIIARIATKAAINQLKKAGVDKQRLGVLKQQFNFLVHERELLDKPEELMNIIVDIDDHINRYKKNNEYVDVIGILYIEFLRYANSDKRLGIVLTPHHIAEFFTKLAQVDKKSVVYDNCAGTGGFLVSAMGKMLEDAKGDTRAVNRIKEKQLFGVELGQPIYPLAVSNMYIHQDGKTNIIHDNCFKKDIMDHIKSKKPTVGILNPPYKADKKKDTEELKYVLNNLECLVEGGKCVAIVPMQCALASRGKIYNLKEKILKYHTLEAVLSMPDELFFNSDVGVVTCVMVITAHKPHPSEKKVYLGYYKDDGFAKNKLQRRADINNKWGDVSKMWLEHFIDRCEEPGLSVVRNLQAKDEWCAEAYMKTDYANINSKIPFENTVHDYVSYLFSNRMIEQTTRQPIANIKEEINTNRWKYFKLIDLFDINGSKTTLFRDLNEVKISLEGYPYVSTQATNNGTKGFVDTYTEDAGVLTVDSAVLGYCAYQERPFSASDHVEKLLPKFTMDKHTAMFLVTLINQEQYRYNYGRKCSQTRLKKSWIKLPATKEGNPDWQFMRNYIKSLPYSANM